MGEAKYKKLRRVEGSSSTVKKKETKTKKPFPKWAKITIVVVLVLVIAVSGTYGVIAAVPSVHNGLTAVTVAGQKITVSEYNYYFVNTLSNFLQQYSYYLSAIGLDLEASLEDQPCYFDSNITWAKYFEQETLKTIQLFVMYSEEAKKAGLELNDSDYEKINEELATLKTTIESQGNTMADYYGKGIGPGGSEKNLRKAYERLYLAQKYNAKILEDIDNAITDTDVEEGYLKAPESYDIVTYHTLFISSGESNETEKAKENADAMVAEITDAASFDALCPKYVSITGTPPEDYDYDSLNADKKKADISDAAVASWLYDTSRQAGDKVALASDGGYYVLYFVERKMDEAATKNVRHILIKYELLEDATTPTDEQKAQAKKQAEEVFAEWQKDPTEDNFAKLAREKSEDTGSVENGGLYEDVAKGEMVEPFEEWIYDAVRKPGDTGIVETDYGYHVMYFVGDGIAAYRSEVKYAIQSERYTAANEELETKNPVKTDWLAMGFVRKEYSID